MRSLWLNILLLFCVTAVAQNVERLPEYEANIYGESVFVNGDYETMKQIRAYWVKECNKLKNRNCEFVLCGNADGVLKATIPARALFMPNDSTLSHNAENVLRPLLQFVLGDNAVATCIIACYSDNNGSEKYLNALTNARAGNIYLWMRKQGVAAESLSFHGYGTKVNRTQNDNVKNRELNRRVSLYFVPNKKMLKLAKKGKL